MLIKLKFLVILVVLLIVGCIEKREQTPSIEVNFLQKFENQDIACITNIIGNDIGYYVADWKSNQIFFYNWDDELLKVFGKPGAGPGEFGKLADIALDEEGFVYATDQVKPIVQKFGPNGNYIESIKIEYPAVGIAALKTGEFIVNCLSPEFAFYLYDINGIIAEAFEQNNLDDNIMLNVLS